MSLVLFGLNIKQTVLFAKQNRDMCKRIPSVQRCLFRPLIVIYAFLVPLVSCMLFI